MLDIAIVNGTLIDGTGGMPRRADVGVRGDRIIEIADLSRAESARRIDARGRLVCPGFIDVHSHSDTYLLLEPSAPSKIYQAVTTEVVGNCGASAAPLREPYRLPSDWRDKPFSARWSSVAEYRHLLEAARPAVNVALLVGHNALRAGVAGYANRVLTREEMRKMIHDLEQSLNEGAAGLSSGLIYPPGVFASTEELAELAAVAGRCGGIYTSHMRSESGHLLEAIRETINIGKRAGVRTQVSHLKAAGKANWALMDEALETIRDAIRAGVDVASDRYPYVASATDLDIALPDWAQDGGPEETLRRVRSPEERKRMREDMLRARTPEDWSSVVIGTTSHPDNQRFRGWRLEAVAEALKTDMVDAVLRLVDMDELHTGAYFFCMSEENMHKVLAEPFVMLGSDASLRSPAGVLSDDAPHPRAYGAFPRFLKMSLDGNTVPLPEAVRKMTSLPAGHFGLKGRGVLSPGSFADIVVIDPQHVCDKATFATPHRLAEGVEAVIVNGTLTLTPAGLTGWRGGRFLEKAD